MNLWTSFINFALQNPIKTALFVTALDVSLLTAGCVALNASNVKVTFPAEQPNPAEVTTWACFIEKGQSTLVCLDYQRITEQVIIRKGERL